MLKAAMLTATMHATSEVVQVEEAPRKANARAKAKDPQPDKN